MARRILVLHGPTLNLEAVLGKHLRALDDELASRATELGLELECVHASSEATLLDALIERHAELAGVLVSPGSLAPIAYSLADALEALKLPCVEVQLKHETKARGKSALRRVVDKQFHGHGVDGYFKALATFAKAAAPSTDQPEQVAPEADDDASNTADDAPRPTLPRGKTIGRSKPVAAPGPSASPGKSIGRAKPGAKVDAVPMAGGSATITRAIVREKLAARLGKKLSGDELAQWARAQWASLQRGASAEPGQAEKLEELLLILSTSAKATDHVILTYAAKLET